MARIRTVKPGLWKHEDLSALPLETHVLAAALLNYADDEGYFNSNPKLILADCFPLRELSRTVPVMLQDLVKIGYLRLFKGTDGKNYGHICKFAQHQVVSHPKDSTIKLLQDSSNPPVSVHDQSTLNGIELNGIELNGTPQRKAAAPTKKTRLPDGFVLSGEMRDYAIGKGVSNPEAQFEKFTNHHTANGSAFLDWLAAWRKWVGNAIEYQPRGSPKPNGDFQPAKKLNPVHYQDP